MNNDFSVRLLADSSGHVTVKLTVTPSSGSRLQVKSGKKLTDAVQIQVRTRPCWRYVYEQFDLAQMTHMYNIHVHVDHMLHLCVSFACIYW